MVVSGRKKAPANLPKKINKRTVISIILMLVWTFVSVVASQYVVGFVMSKLISSDAIDKPVVTAIYSLISYSLTLVLVLLVQESLRSGISIRKLSVTSEPIGRC